ncbi:MmgE/PrpD family protein [Amycolatopsis sp. NPDC047767]|uniref:MmgE/PrpD family protein n=1 Tax=Amycolatopsis sp. NPDC047767 TaxID=3156765 RepID=UPI0034538784
MQTLDLDVDALGEFASTPVAAIPAQIWDFGRLLLLDSLGALLGGLRYPAVHGLGALLGAEAADESAPFGRLTTLGAAATWLDADSGGSFHPAGGRIPPVPTAHPAPHVLPALLHALSRQGVDDVAAVRAFVLGCEVGLRFGAGTSLRPGLHPHGIHGPIGAAVAASALTGADAPTTARAIELAGSLPLAATLAVPMQGGTVRNVWTGLGSYYGALAARLAAAGHEADPGLLATLYGGVVTTDADAEEIGGGLGQRWRVADSYLKPYACARWVHPALDALREALVRAGSPKPASITEIVIETFAFAASLDSLGSESDLHARFSVPRCAASVVVDGHLDAGGFLPGQFERPDVVDLAAKVRLVEVAEYTGALPAERPARVTVVTADSSGTAQVRNARGNPSDPLSVDEIVAKFRGNVGPFLPGDVLDPVVQALTTADLLPDGRSLQALADAIAHRL